MATIYLFDQPIMLGGGCLEFALLTSREIEQILKDAQEKNTLRGYVSSIEQCYEIAKYFGINDIEYTFPDDLQEFLKEAHNIFKTGDIIISVVPNEIIYSPLHVAVFYNTRLLNGMATYLVNGWVDYRRHVQITFDEYLKRILKNVEKMAEAIKLREQEK